jgi:hypothetical protein
VVISSSAQPLPTGSDSQSSVYVHLMSGEVAIISPATSVLVQSDVVLVYNGAQPVASYPRKVVFSCSKMQTSPTLS